MLQNRTKEELLLIVLFVLSFFAFVDGAYLTYLHYNPAASEFCNFGQSLNCDAVNKSPYSTLDNIFYFLAVDLGISVPIITISIPIAIMSLAVFLLIKIGIIHVWHKKSIGWFTHRHIMRTIQWTLFVSLLYGVWLIYIQKFILHTFCVFCLVLDFLILLSLITAWSIDHKKL
ncbi:MAG TPA: vitamin K epoxide reductase family protein [Candidatus Nanoarchaeia archaeon]|nr:vitamin K epoxide reductase family protein [Candidatus Nanoarchaeia archaeon]